MDYAALAKQYGGTTAAPAVDYAALAKQFGGTTSNDSGISTGRTASTQEGTMGAYTPRREVPKPGMFDFLSAPFEMGQALAAKPRAEQAAFIAPTVEALGAASGGLMGAPLGPVGAIGGAGAGYAGAKGLMRLIGGTNVAEPVSQTALRVGGDVGMGALQEVGGRAAVPILGKAIE